MKKALIILIFLTSSLVVADISVFGDQSLINNGLGRNFAENCLVSNMANHDRVDFVLDNGMRATDLINRVNSADPILGYSIRSGTLTRQLNRSSNRVSNYFDAHLRMNRMSEFIFFAGLNDINFQNGEVDTSGLSQLANRMSKSGKKCIFVLPPLLDLPDAVAKKIRNEIILKYNREAGPILANAGCKIIDPSNSLRSENLIYYGSENQTTISQSEMQNFTTKVCQEYTRDLNTPETQDLNQPPAGETQIIETEEAKI